MRVLFYRARPPSTWSRCLADNAHCRRLLLLGAAINWRLFGFSSSHRLQGELMPELSHIDPRSVALLVMDYQVDPLTRVHDGRAVRRCDRVRARSKPQAPLLASNDAQNGELGERERGSDYMARAPKLNPFGHGPPDGWFSFGRFRENGRARPAD
jgi:hypothetical protein